LPICPLCGSTRLIWSHFVSCIGVLPQLNVDHLFLDLLERYIRLRKWSLVFLSSEVLF
jgi:hypothetical protein